MGITHDLHKLAKFSTDIFPVISVYLTPHWHDPHQHAQSAALLRQHLRRARAFVPDTEEGRQSLARDLERIASWGEQCLRRPDDAGAVSYALFTCSGAEVWVEFPSPLPFDNEFTIADRPTLRQLARLDAQHTSALVVLVDAHAIRVCEVVLGGLMTEVDFHGELPEPLQPDTWAQMRYRHAIQEDAERAYQEAAEYINTYLHQQPGTWLILSGQREDVAHLHPWLAARAQQQILDRVPLDKRDAHDRIEQVARATLERHERDEERADVEVLLTSAGRGGLAVVGLQNTLAAVNAGVVHRLMINRDVQRSGWRCQVCDNLGEGMPHACTVCQGSVQAVELGDAMVNEVLRQDGFIASLLPDDRLRAYDGVGALLRYQGLVTQSRE